MRAAGRNQGNVCRLPVNGSWVILSSCRRTRSGCSCCAAPPGICVQATASNDERNASCARLNYNSSEFIEWKLFDMRIQIDLRRLSIFIQVVKLGSFSKAAKVVFATQPTVSKAVKQLESEIGVPLLNRIGHRSELTAAGEIVFRRGLS